MPFNPLFAPMEKRGGAKIQKPGHVERNGDSGPVYIQKPGHVENEKRRPPVGSDAQPTGFKLKKKRFWC